MQNLEANSLSITQIQDFIDGNAVDLFQFVVFLNALQQDNQKLPSAFTIEDCREVGGNKTFPPLPEAKIGMLFLSSGTYEAAVVGGLDKWRRLYDGTTYDPSSNIP